MLSKKSTNELFFSNEYWSASSQKFAFLVDSAMFVLFYLQRLVAKTIRDTHMKNSLTFLTAIILFFGTTELFAQQQQSRCKTEPEYRQFDFWIGDWEVKNPQDQVVGSSVIELTSGDCLILENWTGASGVVGKSMNYYSLYDSKWHQIWVGSGGIPIDFIGNYDVEEKAMRYTAKGIGQNGAEVDFKLTFYHLTDDHIRQHWEQSSDGGETWTTLFDGHYYRRE